MDWVVIKNMVVGGLLMLCGTLGVKIIDVTILSYRMSQVETGLKNVQTEIKSNGTKLDSIIRGLK